MKEIYTPILDASIVQEIDDILNNVGNYKVSIEEIRTQKENLEISILEELMPPNNEPKELTEDWILEYNKNLNEFLFKDKLSLGVKWCNETAMTEKYICLGRELYSEIQTTYPKSYKYLVKYLISHEVGHYLQELHCKNHGQYIAGGKCLSKKRMDEIDQSEDFGTYYSELHNGTDNYSYAIFELMKEPKTRQNQKDMIKLIADTLYSDEERTINYISSQGIPISEAQKMYEEDQEE